MAYLGIKVKVNNKTYKIHTSYYDNDLIFKTKLQNFTSEYFGKNILNNSKFVIINDLENSKISPFKLLNIFNDFRSNVCYDSKITNLFYRSNGILDIITNHILKLFNIESDNVTIINKKLIITDYYSNIKFYIPNENNKYVLLDEDTKHLIKFDIKKMLINNDLLCIDEYVFTQINLKFDLNFNYETGLYLLKKDLNLYSEELYIIYPKNSDDRNKYQIKVKTKIEFLKLIDDIKNSHKSEIEDIEEFLENYK